MIRSIAFFLASLAVQDPAHADASDDRARAMALFEQGTRYFNLGDYQTALPMFEQAYKVSGAAAFLFNLGQTHRMLHRPAEAARLYRAFLREEPAAPNRAEVEQRIKDMDDAANLAQRPPIGVDPPAGPRPASDVRIPPSDSSPAARPLRSRDALAWSLAAASLASLAVSAGLLGEGASLSGRAQGERTAGAAFDDLSRGRAFSVAGGVVVAFAAALAVGAILKWAVWPKTVRSSDFAWRF